MPQQTLVKSAFQLIRKVKANGIIDVSKYVSSHTGLTVTIADVEGPLVKGYFSLATEAHDDSGLPHTLEHLVFLGSQEYPYKGVLDLLANLCLASGTNAWTDQDNTTYTLTTAGSEGFLQLLPVYLDHLLYPLLTDDGYRTEVHHIDGSGEDGGVVYCEMQEFESKPSALTNWTLKKALFPPPSGYGVETGGRIGVIRSALSAERVRNYHSSFYHAKNLDLIIAGMIDHEKVFDCVSRFEDKIMKNADKKQTCTKAWEDQVEPFLDTTEKIVPCPQDDDTKSTATFGWRGPTHKDIYDSAALQTFLEYLSDTAISPLEREFIQIPDPYCSSVSYELLDQLESSTSITFEGVPKEKLALIKEKLFGILNKIASGAETLDMQRLGDLLQQLILKSYSQLETDPHGYLAQLMIGDFLYGRVEDAFHLRMNEVATYRKLSEEPEKFWISLARKYLIDRPYVVVLGDPNKKLVDELTKQEELRIGEQRDRLGDSGLKECEQKLQDSVHANEAETPPPSLFERFHVPDVSKINFITVKSFNNFSSTNPAGNADVCSADVISRVPISTVVSSVQTNFVELYGFLDTSNLSQRLRNMLYLHHCIMFESPIKRNGEILPYEAAVKQLNADTVYHSSDFGLFGDGRYNRFMHIYLKVAQEKFDTGISWLRTYIHDLVIDVDRIRVMAQRIINNATAEKQEGHTVAVLALQYLNYEPGCNTHCDSILRQELFMKQILSRLDTEPDKVVKEMEELNEVLSSPGRSIVHLVCNFDSLKATSDHTPQKQVGSLYDSSSDFERARIFGGQEPLYFREHSSWGKSAIVSVGSCESAFLIKTIQGIRDLNHMDLPVLQVFLQYLTQCEGPIWKEVRGKGLAYGANIYCNAEKGTMVLDLYRSVNPLQAYKETMKVVQRYLNGTTKLDETEFESAKSSLVFEVIEREDTVSAAATQSLLSYFRGAPQEYNKRFVENIWKVSREDATDAGKKYLTQLFEWKNANMAIACHPSKVNGIIKGFEELGVSIQQIELEGDELTAMVQ